MRMGIDGLTSPGDRVGNDDVLIGITVPYAVTASDGMHSVINRKDESVCMRSNESG